MQYRINVYAIVEPYNANMKVKSYVKIEKRTSGHEPEDAVKKNPKQKGVLNVSKMLLYIC